MNDTMKNSMHITEGDALSVTDMQNDFLPGGALAVSGGDTIVPAVNHCISLFYKAGLPIFITRDWHPADHCSFKEKGGPWPPHCVRNTEGAEFSSDLAIPETAVIISKGENPESEQYSTFQGSDSAGNTESALMKSLGIERIFICGLATEYCVLSSVKDARAEGYAVYVLIDAVKAVNVSPGDGEKALREMKDLGAVLVTSSMLAL